jgi:hypothetical protein
LEERKQSQEQPDCKRFDLNPAGLPAHPEQFLAVSYLLDIIVQEARTSRRERHSGFVTPLEKT